MRDGEGGVGEGEIKQVQKDKDFMMSSLYVSLYIYTHKIHTNTYWSGRFQYCTYMYVCTYFTYHVYL